MTFATRDSLLNHLRADIEALAQSTKYRQRMTYATVFPDESLEVVLTLPRFVACQQELALPSQDGRPAIVPDHAFWTSLAGSANDAIVGVRIGVARLVGKFCGALCSGLFYYLVLTSP